jgi:hypothetical protein
MFKTRFSARKSKSTISVAAKQDQIEYSILMLQAERRFSTGTEDWAIIPSSSAAPLFLLSFPACSVVPA